MKHRYLAFALSTLLIGCTSASVEDHVVAKDHVGTIQRILFINNLGNLFASTLMSSFDAALTKDLATCDTIVSVVDFSGLTLNESQKIKSAILAFHPDTLLVGGWTSRVSHSHEIVGQVSRFSMTQVYHADAGSPHVNEIWAADVYMSQSGFDRSTDAGALLERKVVDQIRHDGLLKRCPATTSRQS